MASTSIHCLTLPATISKNLPGATANIINNLNFFNFFNFIDILSCLTFAPVPALTFGSSSYMSFGCRSCGYTTFGSTSTSFLGNTNTTTVILLSYGIAKLIVTSLFLCISGSIRIPAPKISIDAFSIRLSSPPINISYEVNLAI